MNDKTFYIGIAILLIIFIITVFLKVQTEEEVYQKLEKCMDLKKTKCIKCCRGTNYFNSFGNISLYKCLEYCG